MTNTGIIESIKNNEGYPVDIWADNHHLSSRVAASTTIYGGRVVVDVGNGWIHPNAAATDADGIAITALDNSATATKTTNSIGATVRGCVNLVAGGAITKGNRLGIYDNGKVATYSSGMCIGRSLSTCTADGDIIQALVNFENPPAV